MSATMLWCESCGPVTDDPIRLYECSRCSQTSTERRCDTCNIFMARSEQDGCPECEEPLDGEEVEVVEDHDGSWIRAEDYDEDQSLSERQAVVEAQRDAAQKEKASRKLQSLLDQSFITDASNLQRGDVIIDLADPDRTLAVVRVDPFSEDRIDIAFMVWGSLRIMLTRPTAKFRIIRMEPAVDLPVLGPFIYDASTQDLGTASSPMHRMLVEMNDHADSGLRTLTMWALGGNLRVLIGAWVNRDDAAGSLEALEQAGHSLPVGEGQVVCNPNGGWTHEDPTHGVVVRFGTSGWFLDPTMKCVNVQSGRSNVSISDGVMLTNAIAHARNLMEGLRA